MIRFVKSVLALLIAVFAVAYSQSALAAITANDNNTHVDRGVLYTNSSYLTAAGGTAPYSYSVTGGLPVGIVVNADGTLSGATCGSNGSFGLTGTVTDSTNTTVSISPALIVNRAPANGCALTFSGSGAGTPTTTATVGQAYSSQVSASGISGSASYSLASGSLPPGLAMLASGLITGTPTAAGIYHFIIFVQDTAGDTGVSPDYGITVSGSSLSITTSSLPTPVLGHAYNQTVATSGGTAPISFSVSAGALPTGLSLNTGTGAITGTPTTSGAYSFTISATDASPTTVTKAYSGTIAAALSVTTASLPAPTVGTAYSQTIATSGGTAPITFAVTTGSLPAGLSLNTGAGAITGTPTTATSYSFTITATDANSTTASHAYSVTVAAAAALSITTASLPTPVLTQAYNQTVATSGGTAPVTFAVTAGSLPTGLSLNASTGAITGTPTASGAYSFTVTATDSNATTASQAYSGTIAAALSVTTASLPTPVLTQAYSQTLATSGGRAPVTFAVTAGSLPTGLSLNASTGAITGTPTASGAYSFTVTATDVNGITATKSFSGTIAAALSITTASLPTPVLTQAYSQTLATAGGTAPIGFAVTTGALPTGLSLNASTGAITGTPTASGAYSFTVTATDANAITATKAYSGTIAAALSITTASVSTPVVGQSYSQTIATSGGTAPFTFAVSTGSLPAGLSLNASTGAITGTPTTAGAFSFTITATDANSTTSAHAYSGTVGAGFTLTTASLAAPQVGQAYSQTIATSGGTAPVTFAVSAGSLPAGLSLNASTGAIAGTPTTAGAYSFTITATDANSTTASHAYSGTVAVAFTVTTASLPTPVLTQAYSQTLATSGGTAPISFAITTGSLPTGLSLNASTGAITGTPTASGAYSFTVTATDTNSVTAAKAYSGTIAAALSITTASLPTPVLTQAYSQTLATAGGTAPIGFAVTTGALPTGLSLNASTGAITGTPTASGAYSFTVTATDANAIAATKVYSGTIVAALSVTTPSLPAPTPGQPYSQTVATSGGAAPVTFAVTAGALPAGLTLNTSTGVISGTPTTPGAYSFTVTATDANSTTSVKTFTGTVSPPPSAPAPQAVNASVAADAGPNAVPLNLAAQYTAVVITTPPQHGTLTVNGTTVIYTPDPGYVGPDSFAYTATGPGGASLPGVVSITVTPPAPPVAKSPPMSILTEATIKASQSASFDLASLVSGDWTSIVIVDQPQHGGVRFGSGAPAAPQTGSLITRGQTTGAGNANFTAIYTPSTGYAGLDQFSFEAIGPGGTSGLAIVQIRVIAPAPSAPPILATTLAGKRIALDITGPATGGPFTAAAIVSVSGGAGSASLVGGGVATDRSYQLVYDPGPTVSGTVVITYTLTSAFGSSGPLTATITVTPRPDPSLAPSVRGTVDWQAEAARQFTASQLGNFGRRLESLHGVSGGGSGASLMLAPGVTEETDPRDGRREALPLRGMLDAPAPGSSQTSAKATAATPHPRSEDHAVNVWAGGTITLGRRNPKTDAPEMSITSTGVSAGADIRLSDRLTVGAGVGYGHDSATVGGSLAKLSAENVVGVLYAHAQPVDGAFVDGVVGAGVLAFDLKRSVTGATLSATRSGEVTFGSLAAGIDRSAGPLRWSTYGRVELMQANFEGYTEHGSDTESLTYKPWTLRSDIGVLGARISVDRKWGEALVTPGLRLEFRHEFQGAPDQAVQYADWLNGPLYLVPAQGWARNRLTVGGGVSAVLKNGFHLGAELDGEFAPGQSFGTIRVNADKRF